MDGDGGLLGDVQSVVVVGENGMCGWCYRALDPRPSLHFPPLHSLMRSPTQNPGSHLQRPTLSPLPPPISLFHRDDLESLFLCPEQSARRVSHPYRPTTAPMCSLSLCLWLVVHHTRQQNPHQDRTELGKAGCRLLSPPTSSSFSAC